MIVTKPLGTALVVAQQTIQTVPSADSSTFALQRKKSTIGFGPGHGAYADTC